MTVPAPDALRAEIDQRLADCATATLVETGFSQPRGAFQRAVARERAYLAAFRAILDDHDPATGGCHRCITRYCPSYAAVAAALTREDQ